MHSFIPVFMRSLIHLFAHLCIVLITVHYLMEFTCRTIKLSPKQNTKVTHYLIDPSIHKCIRLRKALQHQPVCVLGSILY